MAPCLTRHILPKVFYKSDKGNSMALISCEICIGMDGIGLDTYWPQSDGLSEKLKGHLNLVHKRLSSSNTCVIHGGMVDVHSKLAQQASAFGYHFELLEMGTLKALWDAVSPEKMEEKFMDQWSMAGQFHHCAIGLKHKAGTPLKLAWLEGMECKQIC